MIVVNIFGEEQMYFSASLLECSDQNFAVDLWSPVGPWPRTSQMPAIPAPESSGWFDVLCWAVLEDLDASGSLCPPHDASAEDVDLDSLRSSVPSNTNLRRSVRSRMGTKICAKAVQRIALRWTSIFHIFH
jgi:hypothetical protein